MFARSSRRKRLGGQAVGMKSRVHPSYKTKCRVTNWAECEQGLVQRVDITSWLIACGDRHLEVRKRQQAWRAVEVLRPGYRDRIDYAPHLQPATPERRLRRGDYGAAMKTAFDCPRSHDQGGGEGRAAPVEEGVGLPPSGTSREHLLPAEGLEPSTFSLGSIGPSRRHLTPSLPSADSETHSGRVSHRVG
jgi:hypothetical protein